jgi:hypothetical protein
MDKSFDRLFRESPIRRIDETTTHAPLKEPLNLRFKSVTTGESPDYENSAK